MPTSVGDGPTIRELLENLGRDYPTHVYCRYHGRSWTAAALDEQANRVANGLTALGLCPGDRVGLMLDHHPDHVVAVFALAKAGLVRVSINAHFKGPALAHMLSHAAPRAIIVDHARAEFLAPLLPGTSVELVVQRGHPDPAGAASTYQGLLAHPDASPPSHVPRWSDVLAVNYTSGTTGAPKGALRTDKLLRAGPVAYRPLADMRPGDVFLNWEPIYHAGGFAILIAALMVRVTLDMIDRFSASQYWDQIRAVGATQIHFIGGILPILLKQPARREDRAHKVRVAWGGGCPVDFWRAFEQRYGVPIHEGYGISEIANFVTINTDGRLGSVGRPLPYYDVMLCDDAGDNVPAGEVGEILIRGKEEGLAFAGYFRDPGATAHAMQDGWFKTGDLGRYDADGYLYFIGRKKDSMRRRGVNISAWEVERVIGEHEAVLESALIGVPSGLGDDDLKLFVRLRPGKALDPLDLVKWCEPRMPYFQIPRYIAFIAEFPKTPSERIRKGELPRMVDDCFDLDKSGYRVDRKRVE
ncbi:MAG: AMP-binding protein [Alphaproteobacteria bacterium]|nr:AMP-binding protein [Alphaproteobacteria bacterium]